LGKIKEDQVTEYAERMDDPLQNTERWLASSLVY